MSTYEQAALFEESGLICPWCGESSANEFLHRLNHNEMVNRDMCVSQYLQECHALAAKRREQQHV